LRGITLKWITVYSSLQATSQNIVSAWQKGGVNLIAAGINREENRPHINVPHYFKLFKLRYVTNGEVESKAK